MFPSLELAEKMVPQSAFITVSIVKNQSFQLKFRTILAGQSNKPISNCINLTSDLLKRPYSHFDLKIMQIEIKIDQEFQFMKIFKVTSRSATKILDWVGRKCIMWTFIKQGEHMQ